MIVSVSPRIATLIFTLILLSGVSQGSAPPQLKLVITDLASNRNKSDKTPDDLPKGTLVCSRDENGKVKLKIEVENREGSNSYKWKLRHSVTTDDQGTLEQSNNWNVTKNDLILDEGVYQIELEKLGESGSKREIDILPVTIIEEVESGELVGATGYDKKENAMMVPVEGSNKIKVTTKAPAPLLSKIKFVTDVSGKLSIQPVTPVSGEQVLTLSGQSPGNGVKVQLELDGEKADIFEADVLKRVEKTLSLHAITEQNDDIQVIQPGTNGGANQICVSAGPNSFRDTVTKGGDDVMVSNYITTGPNGICETTANTTNVQPVPLLVPTLAMELYLNKTAWGNQANVHFKVERRDHLVNYDTNNIVGLEDSSSGEVALIRAVASVNMSSKFKMYYVKILEAPIGLANPGFGDAQIQDSHLRSTKNATAHEIGHLLGVSHNDAQGDDRLMRDGDQSNEPTRVARAEWRKANP